MQALGYIQIREALDRALEVFAQSPASLSADDIQLKREIELLRLKVVRSEAGPPSAAKAPAAVPPDLTIPPMAMPGVGSTLPPDLTKAPWSR